MALKSAVSTQRLSDEKIDELLRIREFATNGMSFEIDRVVVAEEFPEIVFHLSQGLSHLWRVMTLVNQLDLSRIPKPEDT